MFCRNCERLVPSDAETCPYCGRALERDETEVPEEIPEHDPADFDGLTWADSGNRRTAASSAGRIHHVVATNDFLNPPDEDFEDYFEPEPFYRRWWFWAIIGVCAAVILVSILILSLGHRNGVPAAVETAPAQQTTPAPEAAAPAEEPETAALFPGLDAYVPAPAETPEEAAGLPISGPPSPTRRMNCTSSSSPAGGKKAFMWKPAFSAQI